MIRLVSIWLVLLAAVPAGAQSVDLRPYWPAPTAGKQRVVQDKRPGQGMTVTRRFVARGSVGGVAVIRLDEYAPGYQATWELADVSGTIEELGTWLGPGVHLVYLPGQSIPWGGTMAVGTYIDRNVQVDVAASTGVSYGPSNFGYQKLTLLSAPSSFISVGGVSYSDVVKIRVYQAWCIDWTCVGVGHVNVYEVDYWLSKLNGPIQIEYISGPGITPGIDYSEAPLTTWETP